MTASNPSHKSINHHLLQPSNFSSEFSLYGSSCETGISKGSGDLQQELVLHVPCNQETVLRARGEPSNLRAGRRCKRQGNGVGFDETRVQPAGPCGVYRWQICWLGEHNLDPSAQWFVEELAQKCRGHLALTLY
ncbi:hypothetical protein PVK06_009645 [Gossypium arboreum]|uniref:Uncharacterized protein n=1 Tax=Gossypium arboreum TaxID=29729 RepID=A0ABR0QPF6_GOSAR|nr:hypothetical protein PVK06_009645 [Gossypium arboreum]